MTGYLMYLSSTCVLSLILHIFLIYLLINPSLQLFSNIPRVHTLSFFKNIIFLILNVGYYHHLDDSTINRLISVMNFILNFILIFTFNFIFNFILNFILNSLFFLLFYFFFYFIFSSILLFLLLLNAFSQPLLVGHSIGTCQLFSKFR